LIATVKAINPSGKVIFSDKKIDTKTLNFWYNFADVVVNIASNEGFGLSGAEALMAGTPIINNVTGGLQDQCGFVDKKGNYIKFTKEFPTNHSGVYREHGDWAYPIFPSNRSLQGSPATPYIFDDRVSFEDVADGLFYWYQRPREERKGLGSKGISFALSPEVGMSAEEMSNRFIKNIGIALENWKPRSKFSVHKITPEKNNKAIGIL
jgi:glycosyltransferase involved in cell wall biosynthesis